VQITRFNKKGRFYKGVRISLHMDIKISDTFKERLLYGLKESEFKELGLSRNPFIPFIPQEIMGTFVNREEEKKMLIRYLPELNTKLIELKRRLSEYYEITIQPKLFQHQLLK